MDRCLLCGHDDPDHAADCPDAPVAPTRSVFVDPDEIARARAALDRTPYTATAMSAPVAPSDGEGAGWDDDFGADWHDDDAWNVFAAGPEPMDGADAADAADPTVAMPPAHDPLAIPIREPAVVSDRAARPPMDPEQRRLVALVGGGLALLVLAVVGALLIGGDGDDGPDTAVAGSVIDGAAADDAGPAVRVEVFDTTTSSAPSTVAPTTAEPTTTTVPTTSTAPSTTTTAAPASSDTGDVPVLSPGQIGRGWVAQVTSVPRRSGGDALQRAYAVVEADAPSAVAIRSDDWPSLRPGFWVIVIPGFDTGAAAVAGCDAAGQGGDCQGRYLSSNAEQNARVCTRAEGGGTRGDCGA